MSRHSVLDTTPARRWEDAFLSGNGESGIMVFGDPVAERVVFNHHRFVLPNGSRDLKPPAVADRLEEVRDLLLAGEAEAAQRLFSDGRPLAWTQPFHPGWVMRLDSASTTAVDDYRRETDFRTGEVTATWSTPTGRHRHRAFASRADHVVVQEWSGPDLDLAVSLSGDLPGRPSDVRYRTTADLPGRTSAVLAVHGDYPDGLGGHGFCGVTRLVGAGGTVRLDGAAAVVRGASRVVLLTVPHRSDIPADEDALRAVLDALPADYDALLRRHTALHTEIYERVELDLGVGEEERALPVSDLLTAQRRDPSAPLPALVERLFHSGRYFLISSSGVLPPRLTGLWLGEWGAAWSGDFTTDANLNLQLAAAGTAAVPEAINALVALVEAQLDDWRDNARAVYGTRGVLAPGRTDGESGHLFHLDDDWPWGMWVAGADWLAQPVHEHWLTTGDEHVLKVHLAPLLVEIATFFEDFLTRRDADGHVVFVPSYSPETGPRGARGVAAVNATMDVAAARHALSAAVEVCSRLGLHHEAVRRWNALLRRLPPYRVDERGALAEWAWPGLETPEDHRHVSHLYPVWPLHDITPDGTPELAAAAHRALRERGDEDLSAHGSLHRALCAARLKDADLVEANLAKILGNDMVHRSLMTTHYPRLDVYNADAAHTLPAVVVEALVDSRPGVVELLPALPARWSRGAIRGVRCRNRTTVDELTWDLDRRTLRVVLCSTVDQRLTVSCRRATGGWWALDLVAGEPVAITLDLIG